MKGISPAATNIQKAYLEAFKYHALERPAIAKALLSDSLLSGKIRIPFSAGKHVFSFIPRIDDLELAKLVLERKNIFMIGLKGDAGQTVLHEVKKADIAELYIEALNAEKTGIGVNTRDNKGRPPLFGASREVAEVLIKHGADLKAKDDEGKNALFYAKDEKHSQFLREKGIPVEPDTKGIRPPYC